LEAQASALETAKHELDATLTAAAQLSEAKEVRELTLGDFFSPRCSFKLK
jgi:hypothetical protein